MSILKFILISYYYDVIIILPLECYDLFSIIDNIFFLLFYEYAFTLNRIKSFV